MKSTIEPGLIHRYLNFPLLERDDRVARIYFDTIYWFELLVEAPLALMAKAQTLGFAIAFTEPMRHAFDLVEGGGSVDPV